MVRVVATECVVLVIVLVAVPEEEIVVHLVDSVVTTVVVTAPVPGTDRRTAFVTSCFRGKGRPVLLRAFCFVLAMWRRSGEEADDAAEPPATRTLLGPS